MDLFADRKGDIYVAQGKIDEAQGRLQTGVGKAAGGQATTAPSCRSSSMRWAVKNKQPGST